MAKRRKPAAAGDARAAAGQGPRRVAMLIYPGVTPLDVVGPLEVFGVCNRQQGRPCYDIVTVAPTADPVHTVIGVTFLPSMVMDDLELPVDTLLVAGGLGPDVGLTPEIGEWLRHASPQARRFGSVCTGAFVLGAAGLIDGRRVTTHWHFAKTLAARHPAAKVEVDPIFIRDGNLYTSAGITAGIDLALALVEEDYGRAAALNVARALVVFVKRSGGQAQFSMRLQAQFSAIPAIQRVQEWCLENLDGDLTTSTMARRAAMSERNFLRLFRRETGRSPRDFVEAARLQAACAMLEETEHVPQTVAARCGFGTATVMRRAFLRRLGVVPAAYRDKFSPALPAAAYRRTRADRAAGASAVAGEP